jgi:hypothetical protein
LSIFSCWSHRTRFSFSIVENALVSLRGSGSWRKFSPAFNLHHSVLICNSASICSLQKRDVPRQLFCFVIYTFLILPKLLQPVQASDTLHRLRTSCILYFPLELKPAILKFWSPSQARGLRGNTSSFKYQPVAESSGDKGSYS